MLWSPSGAPTGTLQELYSCMSILRGYPDNIQRISREYRCNTTTIKMLWLYRAANYSIINWVVNRRQEYSEDLEDKKDNFAFSRRTLAY
jgi:hypothetical protein